MLRLAIVLTALCVAAPAMARNITSEVQYYRTIDIRFSENAHVCGLSDPEPFRELVNSRLSAMDVPHNPDGAVDVVVTITASGSGLLQQSCVGHVLLQLETLMSSDFLNVNAYEGEDQIFTMWSKRQYVFPAIFFQVGAVFSNLAPSVPDETKKVLDKLMDSLAKSRSLK
jgi:hypothetical protein